MKRTRREFKAVLVLGSSTLKIQYMVVDDCKTFFWHQLDEYFAERQHFQRNTLVVVCLPGGHKYVSLEQLQITCCYERTRCHHCLSKSRNGS